MNFSSMEYFAVLAQELSFTRAAERLHITQQSLSSHIAGMEKELGCQLIVRHVPLELTYAGQTLLRYAAQFVKTHTDMRREFCDISQNQRGLLRVGAGSARGRAVLPAAIAAFGTVCPNIAVQLTEASNDVLRQKLLDRELVLAVADFPEAAPGIRTREFYREEIVLLIAKKLFAAVCGAEAAEVRRRFRAGDLSALGAFPFVLGGPDDVDGHVAAEFLRRAGVERPLVRAASHSVGMLAELCAHGVGACFCPNELAESILGETRLRSLLRFRLGEGAGYVVRFGYHEQAYQWSVIETFMNCAAAARG
ncbi:MAG: LysR family transcriptional regulator [Pyramidobacter sp.]|nr:LysR family transcriptional regulator [Pyramidobacter sp.]